LPVSICIFFLFSRKIEYEAQDILICEYYTQKVGEYFSGMITSIAPFGIFVEMDNGVEWLLPLVRLRKKIPTRNVQISDTEGKITLGKELTLQLGEHIEVQLAKIDRIKNRLEFDFSKKIVQ